MKAAYMLPENVENLIRDVRDDHESGATKLVFTAAEVVKALCDHTAIADSDFLSALENTAQQLVAAQPSMAPMFNLANSILLEAESANTVEQKRKRTRHACQAFIANTEEAESNLHKKAAGIIRDGDTILTHSYSSSVLNSLLQAKAAQKNINVICTESRPRNEGTFLAQELGNARIPTRLITDASAGFFMDKIDLVFVGADTIHEKGIINKAGTYLIALAAQAQNIDIYALASTAKFFSSSLSLPTQEPRDPSEVLGETPFNVQSVNFYFDTTPLKLCTGIITENGVMKPEKVVQKLHAMRVHPELQTMLRREEIQE